MATEMDWDSDLGETEANANRTSNDFTTLEEGVYHYTVKKLEKDRYTAGPTSKIPSCPCAIVHLLVKSDDGKLTNYFREKLYLYDENKWRLLKFFTSCGLRKHGDGKTKMPWNDCVGAEGRARIGKKQGTKDETKFYNFVKEWLDPVEVKPSANEDDEY